jgi:hypothetical protein
MSGKNIFFHALLACALSTFLSACGTPAAPNAQPSANGVPSVEPNAPIATETGAQKTLPPVTQYLVGTFQLEGTPNAVDAKTAAELIPLWQSLMDLTANSSSSQTEIDSITDEIKSVMTPAQIQAITAMNLKQHDLNKIIRKLGLTNSKTATTAALPAKTQSPKPTANPDEKATLQAQRALRGTGRPPGILIEALINLLQERATSAT